MSKGQPRRAPTGIVKGFSLTPALPFDKLFSLLFTRDALMQHCIAALASAPKYKDDGDKSGQPCAPHFPLLPPMRRC